MKHYTESKWNELDAIDLWGRNRSSAENIRAAKASYRRRERRVLDRMVEDLVIEELGNDSDYWMRELDAASKELNDAVLDREREHEFAVTYGIEHFDKWYHDEVWRYAAERFAEAFYGISGVELEV